MEYLKEDRTVLNLIYFAYNICHLVGLRWIITTSVAVCWGQFAIHVLEKRKFKLTAFSDRKDHCYLFWMAYKWQGWKYHLYITLYIACIIYINETNYYNFIDLMHRNHWRYDIIKPKDDEKDNKIRMSR